MIEALFRGAISLTSIIFEIFAIIYLWDTHKNISILLIATMFLSCIYAAYKIGKGDYGE